MSYKIKTNIKTLKSVWNVLQESNLDGLLSGQTVDIKINELINTLLIDGKLNELCQIITGETTDFEELEIREVVEILKSFFGNITSQFQGFGQINTIQEKTKKQKS